jgi:hypothetical protein
VKAAPHGDGGFEVVTEGERLTGRRLVLATGSGTSSLMWRGSLSTMGPACSIVPPATATWPRALELIGTRGDLRAIRLAGGETVGCQLGFFSIAHRPLTGLAERLGCQRDAQGYLVVDANGRHAGVGCVLSLENDPRTPPPLPPEVDDRIQITSTGGGSS